MTRQKLPIFFVAGFLVVAQLFLAVTLFLPQFFGIALGSLGVGLGTWQVLRFDKSIGNFPQWGKWSILLGLGLIFWGLIGFIGSYRIFPESLLPQYAPYFWPRAVSALLVFGGLTIIQSGLEASVSEHAGQDKAELTPVIWMFKFLPLILLNITVDSDLAEEETKYLIIHSITFAGLLIWMFADLILAVFHKPRGRYLFRATVMFAVLFILGSILPANGIREPTKRIACRNNLRQLQFMLEQYLADEHSLPPDLKTLHDGGYLSEPGTCVCPTRSGPAVSPDAFRTDYLYTVENDIVTLADKPDNHPHGFVNKISFPLSSP